MPGARDDGASSGAHPCVREGVIVGTGRGYQTLINQALRDYLTNCELEDTLRRVVREELRETG